MATNINIRQKQVHQHNKNKIVPIGLIQLAIFKNSRYFLIKPCILLLIKWSFYPIFSSDVVPFSSLLFFDDKEM